MKPINPLSIIAAKSKIPAADRDKIALPVLVALDAAKRAAAPPVLANTLTDAIMVCVLLWARRANRALYDEAAAAWMAMSKACARPTDLLDLTTGEYQAIRKCIAHYLKAMPQLEMWEVIAAHEEMRNKLYGAK